MLDQGVRLSQSQTLLVGLEATRALDYAHRRGFVHRDIKPANLLFGEDGRLRIADFGLARALAEAAWTEPQGAVLGTARYASPEQAQGQSVDGKADVYSLGLVLIEAVTGTVPFAADTTIATLMARVGKAVEVPDALGPLQKALARVGPPRPGRPARRRRARHRADGQRRGPAAPRAAAARHRGPRGRPHPQRRRPRRHHARRCARRHPPGGAGRDDRGRAAPATPVPSAPPEYLDDDLVVDGPATARRRRWPWVIVAALLAVRRRHGRRRRLGRGAHAQLRGPRADRQDGGGGAGGRRGATASRSSGATRREDGSTPGEVLDTDPEAGEQLDEGGKLVLFVSLGQHAGARAHRPRRHDARRGHGQRSTPPASSPPTR